MDSFNFRFCKKCLTRDMIDKDAYYRTLQELIDNINEEVKTPSEEYERRLLVCTDCDKLYDGMCRGCGCYVELRAAKKSNKCPYEIW